MTTMLETDTTETRSGETVTFGTFTLERTFDVSPQTVFDAWASREAKYAWFAEGDDFLRSVDEYRLDFRVGGQERLFGVLAQSGKTFDYNSVYGDIVDGRRIVATYDVLINGRRISVSLLTVELQAVDGDAGTHLVMTEQGVFLDGLDTNELRIVGARESLDNMEKYLATR
jgi:uncharacterized protein YndB with AHSA1/START domain